MYGMLYKLHVNCTGCHWIKQGIWVNNLVIPVEAALGCDPNDKVGAVVFAPNENPVAEGVAVVVEPNLNPPNPEAAIL